MVKNSRKDRGIDLWHQLRKEKEKGREATQLMQRHRTWRADSKVALSNGDMKSQYQRGGTQISAKQEVLKSVPKRRYSNQRQRGGARTGQKTRPVFHDIWDHDYGDLIMDVKRDKWHLKSGVLCQQTTMIIFMTNVEELWIIKGVGPDR